MRKRLIVLSLFDGMSCGQIALNQLGLKYRKYYASEIDKAAIIVTQTRYPNTIQVGSVCDLRSEDFKDVDLVIGGSPCQSISRAGKVKGITTTDGEVIRSLEHYEILKSQGKTFNPSALFWEFIRMYRGIKQYNPNVLFMLENVTNKEWGALITRELGVEPIFINSSFFSAQNRERNYWTNITIKPISDKGIKIGDVIPCAVSGAGTRGIPKKGWVFDPKHPENKRHTGKTTVRKDFKSNCLTCNPSTTGKYEDINGKIKMLTPTHAEILQTVPVGYTNVDGVSENQRYHMIGNGWTVDVIAHIFSSLKNN